MAPEIWEDQDDDTDLIKQLRKQLRDKTTKVTEAEARAAAAEGTLTEKSLAEVLTAKGVNPKAAKFLRSDGVDAADEKAVTAWLEENSDLFPAAESQGETPPPNEADQATQQGYGQLSGLSQLQRPVDANRLVEANRGLKPTATPEEVAAHFRAAGL